MQLNYKKKTVNCVVLTVVLSIIFYLNNRSNTVHTKAIDISIPEETVEKSTLPTQPLETKYILLWTSADKFPFIYFGNGNSVFKEKKCKYQNCHVTSDRSYLENYRDFDVIAFNGPQLGDLIGRNDLPSVRSIRQKYVYANIEAAIYYPICSAIWNNFFNWTWTYKLDSDTVWGYMIIKNSSNHVIGPSMNIDWTAEDEMLPIDDDIKDKLANKSRAAAWFVSNCRTMSEREKYVVSLQNYLNAYNLNVDVYGDCGDYQCPKNIMNRCLAELERKYYFYLAFENALSEDYVTEKILHALNHNTVPVVYGGANYSRFLPPGSYLDALKLGPQKLAETMYKIIQKPELYHKFFEWRRYYTYHYRPESPDTDDYCRFCAMLNDDDLMSTYSTYSNLSGWWTSGHTCKEMGKPLKFHVVIE